MLRSVTLTDFQSHQNTHLPLSPFTVIVGSSSSGKSAIVRAIRLVAENARGVSYVRQGAKSCRVTLELAGVEDVLDASTLVTIERGKSVSTYELRVAGVHDEPVVFTKCATSVPDAVSTALGLGDAKLWLAGQFDRPYLLDETGAEVARVLGKLTNVTMIYAATRETNRRAAEARRAHTMAVRDLEEVTEAVKKYISLPTRLAAGRAAEEALSRSEDLQLRRDRLSGRIVEVVEAGERARGARSSVRAVPDIGRLNALDLGRSRLVVRLGEWDAASRRRVAADVGRRPVPDTQSFNSLLDRRARLSSALMNLQQVIAKRDRLVDEVRIVSEKAANSKQKFTEALHNAGKCPLCGASSAHAQVDSVL